MLLAPVDGVRGNSLDCLGIVRDQCDLACLKHSQHVQTNAFESRVLEEYFIFEATDRGPSRGVHSPRLHRERVT